MALDTEVTELQIGENSGGRFVSSPTPLLTWAVSTQSPAWIQTRVELKLDDDLIVALDGRESARVEWPFAPIRPRATHSLSVRVTGNDGKQSAWSESREFVAGFLPDNGWEAQFISLSDPPTRACPALFRREFTVRNGLKSAILYSTAHGTYQIEINGAQIDDEVLKPGWTSYQYRLTHDTKDVTPFLQSGTNAMGIDLSGGWYTERFGFTDAAESFYGDQPAAAVQLELTYLDGSVDVIVSDDTWSASSGPRTFSSLYDGEHYDARQQRDGWSLPAFDAGDWSTAHIAPAGVVPDARLSPPVRRVASRAVENVLHSPTGELILDFGQNLVGWLKLNLNVPSGHTIRLRHAEVLENGELGLRPLRRALATDLYTGRGEEQEWEPSSTFHGFRYASIENWPGEFDPDCVKAIVVHSDMERLGSFDSSHELVNRLHENVVWGMRGNFLSVPSDCPQRDERLGWTGDIQVFAPTASFLFDCSGFLTSWLRDLYEEQKGLHGVVPFVVPDVLSRLREPAAAWGDAAVVVPWVLFERYGSPRILAEQYSSMRSWVDTILDIAGPRRLWEGQFQFGDWLDPQAPPERADLARADPDLVASAYLYRSLHLVSQSARVLGHTADSIHYGTLADEVREAFRNEYITPAGRLMSDAQTAYCLAIMFGLCEAGELSTMGARLAELVRSNGYRIGTGFVGTPLIADALTLTGNLEVARRLLLQDECPSWLYPVTMGATTVWERWDSMLEDGSINPGTMTSFNHYALGAIADWLHRTVAGLGPGAPGYSVIEISPHPIQGLDRASAVHKTPYGRAESHWRNSDDGTVEIEAVIPPNTTALVTLPGSDSAFEVGSGRHFWNVQLNSPRASVGPIAATTDLATIIDDPAAYDAINEALEHADPFAAESFRKNTVWGEGRKLTERLFTMSDPAVDAVMEAIDLLNSERGGRE